MSLAIAFADLYTDLKDELGESTADEQVLVRATNRIINDLMLDLDLAETIRTEEILYCGEPFRKYAEPANMKSQAIIDLRPRDSVLLSDMEFLSPFRFNQSTYGEITTVQMGEGMEYIEMIHSQFAGLSTYLTACESLTGDGTWSAGTAVSNITLDNYDYKEGAGSINFDVDTGAGTDAIINFAKTSVVDISAFTLYQRLRFFMKFPSVPTTVTVYWGSDSSNYYAHAITYQPHGAAFTTTGWNEIEAQKDAATIVGSPDDEKIDFFAIKLSFDDPVSATDFKIDCIKIIKPEAFVLEYYATDMVIADDGTYQEALTVEASNSDSIVMQKETRQVLIDGVCWRYLKGSGDIQSKKDAAGYQNDYEIGKMKIKRNYPSRRKNYKLKRLLPRLSF